ncbi:MAG: trehalose-6-phosphate synthase, partial [Actinobacteria bacterium]|nr:trehalose-6-phosphate synthase [Actinomycetota bacterium]
WATRMRRDQADLVVVRVDRLDPAKNALRGFEAFELLLERRPDLQGRVRFVACLVPSRESVPEYRWYAEQTWSMVKRINERFPDSVTVHYGNDMERGLGALTAYDVLLVNPVLDGMNLVAQEGALVNTRNGVLLLSGGAGCADLLADHAVVIANARDVGETADALERALSMPASERLRLATQARSVIRARTPGVWLAEQLDGLRAAYAGDDPPPDTRDAPGRAEPIPAD